MPDTEKKSVTELPIWNIPVTWRTEGIMRIPAPTLQEALNIARIPDEPLPEGTYLAGSFEPLIPYTETIRRNYNHNQPDMV